MNCVSLSETRREPIHGGSIPASMRERVSDNDTQPMSPHICGAVVANELPFFTRFLLS